MWVGCEGVGVDCGCKQCNNTLGIWPEVLEIQPSGSRELPPHLIGLPFVKKKAKKKRRGFPLVLKLENPEMALERPKRAILAAHGANPCKGMGRVKIVSPWGFDYIHLL